MSNAEKEEEHERDGLGSVNVSQDMQATSASVTRIPDRNKAREERYQRGTETY